MRKDGQLACSGLHAMAAGAVWEQVCSTPTAEKDNLSTRTKNLCPLFGANCNHSLKVTSASAIDAMVVPSGSSKSTCSSHRRSEETPCPSTFKGFARVMSNKAEATKIRFRRDRTLAHVGVANLLSYVIRSWVTTHSLANCAVILS